jgi:hypothetical protein
VEMQQPRGEAPDTWIGSSHIAKQRNNADAIGLQSSGISSRDGGRVFPSAACQGGPRVPRHGGNKHQKEIHQ